MTNRPKSKQADPRVLRTRLLIRNAFVDLLEEIDLEKLTVNRITERATINRVTFYLHYRDIPDMLDKMADDIISEMKSVPSEAGKEPTSQLIAMLEHIADNAKLFKLMLSTQRVPVFTERFTSVMRGVISDRIEERLAGSDQQEMPADITAWYLTSALLGTIIYWLRHDMPYRPEYLAKQIHRLAPRI